MFFLTLLYDYVLWHYGASLLAFVRVYKNFWWFLVQFFSIPQLSKSLFAPYKKMTEKRGSLLDLQWLLGFIIINTLSRLLGFSIRLTIICAGLFCLSLLSLTALLGFSLWLVAPLLLVYCFSYGLYLLF